MRKLRVFLCHASDDKPAVQTLYASLKSVPWIDPWLDEKNILPGQDWNLEIEKAIRDADAIIGCLSKKSVSKEGYVQKEMKRALEMSDEKPDGTIFIIPLLLDDCEVPLRFSKLQWAYYYGDNGEERLLDALRLRTIGLGIQLLDLEMVNNIRRGLTERKDLILLNNAIQQAEIIKTKKILPGDLEKLLDIALGAMEEIKRNHAAMLRRRLLGVSESTKRIRDELENKILRDEFFFYDVRTDTFRQTWEILREFNMKLQGDWDDESVAN